jgi:hypothetical protein
MGTISHRGRKKRTYQRNLQRRKSEASEALAIGLRGLVYGKDAERKREALREIDR